MLLLVLSLVIMIVGYGGGTCKPDDGDAGGERKMEEWEQEEVIKMYYTHSLVLLALKY